ncbi:MAG: hypothetical protein HQL11_01695, partial [Candidatus Omnitrophica bacterium]|nr:hypothetical protein [Candidatus Omnitrophota bacterium]
DEEGRRALERLELNNDVVLMPVGDSGGAYEAIANPTDETLALMEWFRLKGVLERDMALSEDWEPTPFPVLANSSLESTADLESLGADGVGLVRTEIWAAMTEAVMHQFLDRFAQARSDQERMTARDLLTYELAQTYREAMERQAHEGKEYTLRTLDLRMDKNPEFLKKLFKVDRAHPDLGLLGGLEDVSDFDFYKTKIGQHLLASQMASIFLEREGQLSRGNPGPLKVMIPRIRTAEDIDFFVEHILPKARGIVEQKLKTQAVREAEQSITFGAMIETAEALRDRKRIIAHPFCKFFSIGTNDLTAEILAAQIREVTGAQSVAPIDRDDPHFAEAFTVLNAAVLAECDAFVADVGEHNRSQGEGKAVGFCGQIAGSGKFALFVYALQKRHGIPVYLSVAPDQIAMSKFVLRRAEQLEDRDVVEIFENPRPATDRAASAMAEDLVLKSAEYHQQVTVPFEARREEVVGTPSDAGANRPASVLTDHEVKADEPETVQNGKPEEAVRPNIVREDEVLRAYRIGWTEGAHIRAATALYNVLLKAREPNQSPEMQRKFEALREKYPDVYPDVTVKIIRNYGTAAEEPFSIYEDGVFNVLGVTMMGLAEGEEVVLSVKGPGADGVARMLEREDVVEFHEFGEMENPRVLEPLDPMPESGARIVSGTRLTPTFRQGVDRFFEEGYWIEFEPLDPTARITKMRNDRPLFRVLVKHAAGAEAFSDGQAEGFFYILESDSTAPLPPLRLEHLFPSLPPRSGLGRTAIGLALLLLQREKQTARVFRVTDGEPEVASLTRLRDFEVKDAGWTTAQWGGDDQRVNLEGIIPAKVDSEWMASALERNMFNRQLAVEDAVGSRVSLRGRQLAYQKAKLEALEMMPLWEEARAAEDSSFYMHQGSMYFMDMDRSGDQEYDSLENPKRKLGDILKRGARRNPSSLTPREQGLIRSLLLEAYDRKLKWQDRGIAWTLYSTTLESSSLRGSKRIRGAIYGAVWDMVHAQGDVNSPFDPGRVASHWYWLCSEYLPGTTERFQEALLALSDMFWLDAIPQIFRHQKGSLRRAWNARKYLSVMGAGSIQNLEDAERSALMEALARDFRVPVQDLMDAAFPEEFQSSGSRNADRQEEDERLSPQDDPSHVFYVDPDAPVGSPGESRTSVYYRDFATAQLAILGVQSQLAVKMFLGRSVDFSKSVVECIGAYRRALNLSAEDGNLEGFVAFMNASPRDPAVIGIEAHYREARGVVTDILDRRFVDLVGLNAMIRAFLETEGTELGKPVEAFTFGEVLGIVNRVMTDIYRRHLVPKSTSQGRMIDVLWKTIEQEMEDSAQNGTYDNVLRLTELRLLLARKSGHFGRDNLEYTRLYLAVHEARNLGGMLEVIESQYAADSAEGSRMSENDVVDLDRGVIRDERVEDVIHDLANMFSAFTSLEYGAYELIDDPGLDTEGRKALERFFGEGGLSDLLEGINDLKDRQSAVSSAELKVFLRRAGAGFTAERLQAAEDALMRSPVFGELDEEYRGYLIRALRMGDVIRSVSAYFLEESESEPADIDVGRFLDSLSRLSRKWKGRVSVVSSEPRMDVRLRTVEFMRIMMNLLVNAAEASKDTEEPIVIDVGWSNRPGYLRVGVRDQGVGMAETVRRRIFEPGFTTKSDQGGTGRGLAIVKELVGSLGGLIHVESAPGEGTLFVVELPEEPSAAVTLRQAGSRFSTYRDWVLGALQRIQDYREFVMLPKMEGFESDDSELFGRLEAMLDGVEGELAAASVALEPVSDYNPAVALNHLGAARDRAEAFKEFLESDDGAMNLYSEDAASWVSEIDWIRHVLDYAVSGDLTRRMRMRRPAQLEFDDRIEDLARILNQIWDRTDAFDHPVAVIGIDEVLTNHLTADPDLNAPGLRDLVRHLPFSVLRDGFETDETLVTRLQRLRDTFDQSIMPVIQDEAVPLATPEEREALAQIRADIQRTLHTIKNQMIGDNAQSGVWTQLRYLSVAQIYLSRAIGNLYEEMRGVSNNDDERDELETRIHGALSLSGRLQALMVRVMRSSMAAEGREGSSDSDIDIEDVNVVAIDVGRLAGEAAAEFPLLMSEHDAQMQVVVSNLKELSARLNQRLGRPPYGSSGSRAAEDEAERPLNTLVYAGPDNLSEREEHILKELAPARRRLRPDQHDLLLAADLDGYSYSVRVGVQEIEFFDGPDPEAAISIGSFELPGTGSTGILGQSQIDLWAGTPEPVLAVVPEESPLKGGEFERSGTGSGGDLGLSQTESQTARMAGRLLRRMREGSRFAEVVPCVSYMHESFFEGLSDGERQEVKEIFEGMSRGASEAGLDVRFESFEGAPRMESGKKGVVIVPADLWESGQISVPDGVTVFAIEAGDGAVDYVLPQLLAVHLGLSAAIDGDASAAKKWLEDTAMPRSRIGLEISENDVGLHQFFRGGAAAVKIVIGNALKRAYPTAAEAIERARIAADSIDWSA